LDLLSDFNRLSAEERELESRRLLDVPQGPGVTEPKDRVTKQNGGVAPAVFRILCRFRA